MYGNNSQERWSNIVTACPGRMVSTLETGKHQLGMVLKCLIPEDFALCMNLDQMEPTIPVQNRLCCASGNGDHPLKDYDWLGKLKRQKLKAVILSHFCLYLAVDCGASCITSAAACQGISLVGSMSTEPRGKQTETADMVTAVVQRAGLHYSLAVASHRSHAFCWPWRPQGSHLSGLQCLNFLWQVALFYLFTKAIYLSVND